MTPRPLPSRPEAEAAILGGVLLRGREALVEALEQVAADDFYSPRHAAVLTAMRLLDERGEPIDAVTLAAQLDRTGQLELVGGLAGIAMLDRHATAHGAVAHAALVREAAVARRLVVFHRSQAEQILEGLDNLADYVVTAQAEHAAIASSAHGDNGLVSIRDALLEGMREVTERSKGTGNATRFGFPEIDREYGGMLPGELWLLGGRTGNGKSALAASITRNQVFVADPRSRGTWHSGGPSNSAFFGSNEMTGAALALRWLSELAKVDGSSFRSPSQSWLEANWNALREGMRLLGHSPITLGFRPGYTIDQAAADCRLWHRRELAAGRKPKLAVFDYVQNFGVPRRLQSEYRTIQIAYITKLLKALAQELKIPVLALMQLNRGPEERADGRPQIRDLRESGAPEQDADGIGLIWRPERYHPERTARAAKLKAYDARISTPGQGLTEAEREEYSTLYRERLRACIEFPKVREGEADRLFELEFTPEYTRFLPPPNQDYEG